MTSDGALSTLLLLLAERHLDAVRCWPEAAGGGARGAFLVTHAVVRGGGECGRRCGDKSVPGRTCSGEGGSVGAGVVGEGTSTHLCHAPIPQSSAIPHTLSPPPPLLPAQLDLLQLPLNCVVGAEGTTESIAAPEGYQVCGVG